jgi:hypothetical protein
MKILLSTASFGAPLKSYWAVQQSKHEIDYRRYDDGNFPERSYSLTPVLKSKMVKMLSHEINPGHDFYIWMDSTHSIYNTDTADRLLDELEDNDIAIFRHGERTSIMQEADKIERFIRDGYKRMQRRAGDEPVRQQAEMYRADPEFTDDKLFHGSMFIYRPDNCAAMMQDWYYQVCRYSIRDQISLPYMIYKHGLKVKVLPGSVFSNDFFYFDKKLFLTI